MKTILATAIVAALLLSGCSSSTNRTEDARVASTQPAATSSETSASITAREATETQPLPTAPGTETTTTTISPPEPSSTTTTSNVPSETPETSIPPSTTSTSTTTTTTSTTTTTTTLAPAVLRVKVLNGSGVDGAAGRLTNKLSQAGFDVLPAGNAPRRYSASAVYYAEGWLAEAKEILAEADIDEIEEPTAMPQQFASEEAVVVVLLGTDTAPARTLGRFDLRPNPNVKLPLGDYVPRDRYVPGLANILMHNEQNEADPEVFEQLERLTDLMNEREGWSEGGNWYDFLTPNWQAIEESLEWFGFTPQNVCGAPAGYSFTDLVQTNMVTRKWDEQSERFGDPSFLFTTDRLLEVLGGERINPETNLDFYIQQAVQTLHDSLAAWRLDANILTPQLILCTALVFTDAVVKDSISEFLQNFFNRQRKSTASQQYSFRELLTRTMHVKAISRNGNFAIIFTCATYNIGPPYLTFNILVWRNAGYRVTQWPAHGSWPHTLYEDRYADSECQEVFDAFGVILPARFPQTELLLEEDMIFFNFDEHVFSASDLLDFPRG